MFKLIKILNNYSFENKEEWLEKRKKHLNSSEIHSSLSCKNEVDFLLIKNKFNKFKGNESTLFGCIFEPIAINFIQNSRPALENGQLKLYHKLSSITYEPSKNMKYPLAATPDCIYVDTDNKLVNIEIKCPRIRKPDNKIPSRYKTQVISAAMCVDASYSEFWDFEFRICDYHYHEKFIKNPTLFNEKYHNSKILYNLPLCVGFLTYNVDVWDYLKRGGNIFTKMKNSGVKCTGFKWGIPNHELGKNYIIFKLFTANKIIIQRDNKGENKILNLLNAINNTFH